MKTKKSMALFQHQNFPNLIILWSLLMFFFLLQSRTVSMLQERELSMKMMNAREAEVQRNDNALFFNFAVFGIFQT
jgi:hypothetical protein